MIFELGYLEKTFYVSCNGLTQGREIDAWREFYEELVASCILSHENFGYIQTNYIGRHITSIKFSPQAQTLERFVAEIYEAIPSEEQEALLRNLIPIQSDEYIWVNEDSIMRLGAKPGQESNINISPTAEWTL